MYFEWVALVTYGAFHRDLLVGTSLGWAANSWSSSCMNSLCMAAAAGVVAGVAVVDDDDIVGDADAAWELAVVAVVAAAAAVNVAPVASVAEALKPETVLQPGNFEHFEFEIQTYFGLT